MIIELEGFRTYRDRTIFDIPEGVTTLIWGENGTGKSNFRLGLRWAIIGEMPPKVIADRIGFHGGAAEAVFTNGNFKVRQTRAKTGKNGTEIWINGDLLKGTPDQVREKLFVHLGVGDMTPAEIGKEFDRAVCINPKSDSIFSMLPTARMAYLLSLFKLEELEELRNKAVKRFNSNRDLISTMEVPDFQAQVVDLDKLNLDIAHLQDMLEDSMSPHFRELEGLKAQALLLKSQSSRMHSEYDTALVSLQAEVLKYPAFLELAVLEAEVAGKIHYVEISRLETSERQLKEKLSALKLDAGKVETQKNAKLQELAAFETVDTAGLKKQLEGVPNPAQIPQLEKEQAEANGKLKSVKAERQTYADTVSVKLNELADYKLVDASVLKKELEGVPTPAQIPQLESELKKHRAGKEDYEKSSSADLEKAEAAYKDLELKFAKADSPELIVSQDEIQIKKKELAGKLTVLRADIAQLRAALTHGIACPWEECGRPIVVDAGKVLKFHKPKVEESLHTAEGEELKFKEMNLGYDAELELSKVKDELITLKPRLDLLRQTRVERLAEYDKLIQAAQDSHTIAITAVPNFDKLAKAEEYQKLLAEEAQAKANFDKRIEEHSLTHVSAAAKLSRATIAKPDFEKLIGAEELAKLKDEFQVQAESFKKQVSLIDEQLLAIVAQLIEAHEFEPFHKQLEQAKARAEVEKRLEQHLKTLQFVETAESNYQQTQARLELCEKHEQDWRKLEDLRVNLQVAKQAQEMAQKFGEMKCRKESLLVEQEDLDRLKLLVPILIRKQIDLRKELYQQNMNEALDLMQAAGSVKMELERDDKTGNPKSIELSQWNNGMWADYDSDINTGQVPFLNMAAALAQRTTYPSRLGSLGFMLSDDPFLGMDVNNCDSFGRGLQKVLKGTTIVLTSYHDAPRALAPAKLFKLVKDGEATRIEA
jgi:hypothetical protein